MHLDECNICGKCLIFIAFFIDFFIPIYSDLLKKDREIAALKAEKIKLEVEERASRRIYGTKKKRLEGEKGKIGLGDF